MQVQTPNKYDPNSKAVFEQKGIPAALIFSVPPFPDLSVGPPPFMSFLLKTFDVTNANFKTISATKV